jgi:Carboxypeptidase regulatory-like domain/TonB dependent receptor
MKDNPRKWHWVPIIAIAVVLLVNASDVYAQAASATITGRVLDPKGASVPGATVTATNTETGIVRTTTTTTDGLYRLENLSPGKYDVVIQAPSFAKLEVKNVKLQVGEQRDVNVDLQLSGQAVTVLVTSEMPLIEATKTDVSTVIDDKVVANLPTTTSFQSIGGVANDYAGLAVSAPGVKYDFTGNSSDLIGPGAVSDRGILYNVDGVNIADQVVSARDALGASVEEVKEFQVLSNNYNAEYGQAGNLIMNVITKSGTNSFHGDGHAYFRGRNLGASDFFYNQTSCDPTITGPGSCDNPADAGFPSHRAPFHKHEYGFTAGGPFVKDRTFWFVSTEDVQQGQPLTLRPFNTSVTVNQPTKELLWSAKVDHKLTAKHSLVIRYNIQRDLTDNLLVQTGPNTDASGLVSQTIHDNSLNIGLISTPTDRTVNEARFYWHRFLTQTPTKSTQPGQAGPNFYTGADFCCPQGGLQNRYQYIDNVSWTHGAHTLKAGVNISHFPYDSLFQQFHFGEYTGFSGGVPTEFDIGVGPGFVHASDTIYGLYVQDSWQLRRNLTLNYGLRYDIEDGAFKGGMIQNPNVPGGCTEGNGLIPACSSDKNNWQPRVGLAWSPQFDSGIGHALFGGPGKTVIRLAGAEVTEMAYLNVVLDSLNFDGTNLFTVAITDPTVLSSFPNRPPDSALAPFTQGVRTNFGRVRPIATNLHNPEIRMASVVINRQVSATTVFEVGYQGVFGFGQFGERDTNFPTPVADPAHPGFFYLPKRPDPSFAAIRTNENSRTTAYHGGYVSVQKRLSHHLQFQGSYTYSKTLASGEDFWGLSEPSNPFNIRADRSRAQNDIRHLGNFSFITDTENIFSNALLRPVLNNWTFGVLGTLQSGRPYPVSTGAFPFSGSRFFGPGSETQQRPNVLPDGTLVATNIADHSGSDLAISAAGVALCQQWQPAALCPAATTFLAPAGASASGPVDSYTGDPVDFQFLTGNLERNAGLSRPIYRFDISVTKAFPIRKWESARLELKLDVFNVFNHPLLYLNNGNDALNVLPINSPTTTDANGNTISNPNFVCTAFCIDPFTGHYLGAGGRVLNIQDFRSGRVDKDLNPSRTAFAGLGDPSGNVSPRIMQLAIRFRW